jgi:hypothetical protein
MLLPFIGPGSFRFGEGREVGILEVPSVFPMCSHSVLIKISIGSQHVLQVPSSYLLYPSSFALSSTLCDLAQRRLQHIHFGMSKA